MVCWWNTIKNVDFEKNRKFNKGSLVFFIVCLLMRLLSKLKFDKKMDCGKAWIFGVYF